MNLVEIQDAVERDLRVSPSGIVIYLEGKTDPALLFALLGLPNPPDGIHQGILVKGLKEEGAGGGSGSKAVMARVDLAPRFEPSKVVGIIDGDGMALGTLAASFDTPYPGPLFTWKAYCIENLVVKTGWPTAWGEGPDWQARLLDYGPYVALNRIGLEVRSILEGLRLMNFTKPILGESHRPAAEIAASLAEGKSRLQSFDVEREFGQELSAFEEIVQRSTDEAHALINGKWLIRHLAPTLTKRDPDICQFEWIAHARSAGGLPEVRDWWEQVTGSPP